MSRDIFSTREFAPAVEGIREYLAIQLRELRGLCVETAEEDGERRVQVESAAC